jgi:hypothetical protein
VASIENHRQTVPSRLDGFLFFGMVLGLSRFTATNTSRSRLQTVVSVIETSPKFVAAGFAGLPPAEAGGSRQINLLRRL